MLPTARGLMVVANTRKETLPCNWQQRMDLLWRRMLERSNYHVVISTQGT